MTPDPRQTPARPDLPAAHLRGQVEAPRYAEAQRRVVGVPLAPMTARPEADAPMTSQILFGEAVDVYDTAQGWAWIQSALDGYVGYVPAPCLEPPGAAPTHRVATLSALIYPQPAFKSRPLGALPFGARVAAAAEEEGWVQITQGGWIPSPHLTTIGLPAPDWPALAEGLRGVPYLWGGRSSQGIDCSGLVQIALQAAGIDCPRDSDQQEAALGTTLAPGARPVRGDLVFWRGHVGVMLSASRLLHANIHHMAVAVEPLSRARARIRAGGGGPVTRIARIGAG